MKPGAPPDPRRNEKRRARARLLLERRRRDALASDPKALRLVVLIAQRLHERLPSCFDLDDLIQAGNVALVESAARYSPATKGGAPFTAFARQAIRGAMLDTCRRNRYVEQTRTSIDDPGNESYDGEYVDVEKYGPEPLRALFHLATRPTVDVVIDRARLYRRVMAAVSLLSAPQRKLLRAWYVGDHSRPWEPASRALGINFADAKELHARAIARLRILLQAGSARPRGRSTIGTLPRAA